MNRILFCLMVLATATLAGCGATDFTEPNDTLETQQRARDTRALPGPTELPPGLGEDLPSSRTPVTAPQTPR